MDIKDIERIESVLREDVNNALNKGNVERSIQLIDAFADTVQSINNIFRDSDVEYQLRRIAQQYIDSGTDIREGNPKKILFYDQIGTTVCLGVQYLQGLIANGYEVDYVCEKSRGDISAELLEYVKKNCNSYHIFKSQEVFQNGEFLANTIRRIIIDANPSKIISHSPGRGALGISVMYSIHGCEKIRIVPGDHHFYTGIDCFDKFIEFRRFGISIAHKERGIPLSKLYILPYYPLVGEGGHFDGFPFERDGKVVFFAAGAEYKFVGSDVFYKICEKILSDERTVITYAGKPSKRVLEYSKKTDRFVLLGYRKDFNLCVAHSDVLINSYPIGGALVCQTAAYYGKPIIAYCDEREFYFQNVTDVFGGDGITDPISYTDMSRLLDYTEKLTKDKALRDDEGWRIKQLLQTKEQFNDMLPCILEGTAKPTTEKDLVVYDADFMRRSYMWRLNNWHPSIVVAPIRTYRIGFLWKFKFLYPVILQNMGYVTEYIVASYRFVRKLLHR